MFNQIKRFTGCSTAVIWKNVMIVVLDAIVALTPYLMVYLMLVEMLKKQPSHDNLFILAATLIVCVLFRIVVIRFIFIYHSEFSSEAGYKMRIDMTRKLTRIPMGKLLSMDLGTLNNTLLKDVEFTEHTLSHVISYALGIVCLSVLLISGLAFFDWRLALSMVVGLPIAIFLFNRLSILTKKSKYRLYKAGDDLTSAIFEYVMGIRVLRAFGRAEGQTLQLEKKVAEARDAHLKYEIGASLAPAAFIVFTEAGFAAMLMSGVYFVSVNTLSISVFLLFLLVSTQFYRPLTQLAILLAQFKFFLLSMNRIQNVLELEELETQAHQTREPSPNAIEFKDVSFQYQSTQVVDHLNVAFPTHSVTALVGASGSGKSTVMNLIARFWDAGSGQVMIEGRDVKSMSQEEIATQISMVFQDVYLFDETIYNNLTMGSSVTLKKVEEACRMAQCWEFIQQLPDGMNSSVGEGGVRLSGGEKQRISIARALIKDAPIILLDEATAALDPENEAHIQQAITHLVKNKTVIVIAHNLFTVAQADQILVLDKGKLEAIGKHEELLLNSTIYKTLWNDQLSSRQWRL